LQQAVSINLIAGKPEAISDHPGSNAPKSPSWRACSFLHGCGASSSSSLLLSTTMSNVYLDSVVLLARD
jgi:hypothetical protein